MPNHQLSKSTILGGIQCSKFLYLYKHKYELRSTDSSNQQSIFESGTEVGLLARNLFPDGVDASSNQGYKMKESVEKTRDYIDASETKLNQNYALQVTARTKGTTHIVKHRIGTFIAELL